MTRPARRWRDDPERRPSAAQQLAGTMFAPVDARAETRARHEAEHSEHRRRLLEAFQRYGPMTPDEAGARVGLNPLQARPRCTQLQQSRFGAKLRPSGRRGVSALGNPAAILELTLGAENG